MRHKPCHASNVEMTVSVTHLLKDTSRFDAKNTADQNGNQVITPFIHHGDIHGSWSLHFCHYLCTYICTNTYLVRCVVTCTFYHILQICSQSNALLLLLQHWGQKLSKSYTSSCCKSKFMSSNIFYFIFSSVRYMQLAVKQFPSTVIILSISLLFSSFNECNIYYTVQVRVYLSNSIGFT